MNKFTHVLVAACPGFLEVPVLEKAARVAEANGAKLTVLDVVEPIPARSRFVDMEGRKVDIQALLIDDRRRYLHETLDSAGLANAAVKVVAGTPFIEVTRFVMAHDCDLVIVGESPRVEGQARVVASDVTQLIRACPTPVWVMCPSRAQKLRVLALVEPDPSDPVKESLNESVLTLATSATRWGDGELHVAHAWQLPGESILRSAIVSGILAAEVDALVRKTREEHRTQLDELVERHRAADLGGQTHLIEGSPRVVLPELAERLEINLIVMGTVARRGLSALIIGNTAEAMLRSVRCSILTVKPEGFTSPVSVEPAG